MSDTSNHIINKRNSWRPFFNPSPDSHISATTAAVTSNHTNNKSNSWRPFCLSPPRSTCICHYAGCHIQSHNQQMQLLATFFFYPSPDSHISATWAILAAWVPVSCQNLVFGHPTSRAILAAWAPASRHNLASGLDRPSGLPSKSGRLGSGIPPKFGLRPSGLPGNSGRLGSGIPGNFRPLGFRYPGQFWPLGLRYPGGPIGNGNGRNSDAGLAAK
jgi:hypothetical protein